MDLMEITIPLLVLMGQFIFIVTSVMYQEVVIRSASPEGRETLLIFVKRMAIGILLMAQMVK